MRRRLLRAAAVVLLVAAVWGVLRLFPGPEERVRRRLLAFAEAVSFAGEESTVRQLAYVGGLEGFFTPDVEVRVQVGRRGGGRIAGRAELREAAGAARLRLRGLKVEFFDIVVSAAPDRSTAQAHLTSKIQIAGDNDYFVQEFRLDLVRGEQNWQVRRLETVETMEP
ncbi:MAG: nuclear transport factor 2 family protein [Limisphaerales bacterium]